jgi:rhodanese-related sulfurtransferase
MMDITSKAEQDRSAFLVQARTLYKNQMKKYLIIPITVVLLALCNVSKAQVLSPAAFEKKLAQEKGILIDVRSAEEYQNERIKGAKNIDVTLTSFKSRIDSLDKTRAYFVYCGIGKRSAKAATIMRESGFKKVYDLEKGLGEWKSKGFETIKGIPAHDGN